MKEESLFQPPSSSSSSSQQQQQQQQQHRDQQRFVFNENAELILISQRSDNDDNASVQQQQQQQQQHKEDEKGGDDDEDDDAWIDMALKNFTGRLVVRKRRKRRPRQPYDETRTIPSRDIDATKADDATAHDMARLRTPVIHNKSFSVKNNVEDDDDDEKGSVGADTEMPSGSPPRETTPHPPFDTGTATTNGGYADVSTQGYAVIDNASLSLPAIQEVVSDDTDNISEQVRRFMAQVDDPSRMEEDTIQFANHDDDDDDDDADDDGRRSSERVDSAQDGTDSSLPGVSDNGLTEPSERTGSLGSIDNANDGSDTDLGTGSSHWSDGGGGGRTGSDFDIPARGNSVRGRRPHGGLSKTRRASSLGPKRGLGRSSPLSIGGGDKSPNNEFFNRAVGLFKHKGGEGKKRMPSKEFASTSDISQQDSGPVKSKEKPDKGVGSKTGATKTEHAQNWGKLMQVYSIKNHVPATIRQKRINERRASMSQSSGQASSKWSFPTRLHEICAEPDATLAELIECLEDNKEAVFLQDQAGKLPLHILGDNEGLVSSSQGKQVATAFAWKLMEAHPEAITQLDKNGFMPFVTLIADWVTWVYETHKKMRKAKLAASPGLFLRANNVNNDSDQAVTNRDATSNTFFARKTDDFASTTRLFPKPEVWDEVEWCFNMLSMALDELAGKSGSLFKTTRRDVFASHHHNTGGPPTPKKPDAMRREIVCHLISVLPTLLKTVLLIETEGGETRRRILKMSVFRRMYLCKECIGDWLTHMLRKNGSASRRAVDFLELISDTSVRDYTGGHRATLVDDIQKYHEEKEAVFDAVNDLEGTIGSLVTMENRQTERAAATGVIWHIMGDRLARPFVLGLVLVDLVLHISLMVAFRNNVQIAESTIEISDQSVLFICSHYLIRKGCEALALLTISPSIFRGYFTNVWTLFDLMAIILTMAAFAWNSKNPGSYRNGFNAFVVGLLWMKVVGFLKVVNKQMATFILALLEILGDIKYFLVVLVVVIFMFGDMFHLAVSTKDNGAFCERDDLEGPTLDFCNGQLTKSYLRVYSILLGDFELNDLQDSTGITTIYVIFTSLGVVILLNVLIAVIADSYEKATMSSSMLFGRARVTFVAQNEALEAFLRPGVNPLRAFRGVMADKNILSRLFTIFRWFVLLGIIATAGDTALFLVILGYENLIAEGNRGNPSFTTATFIIVLFLILISALGVLIGFAFEGMVHRMCPSPLTGLFDRINRICVSVVRWLAFRLFGLHSRKHLEPNRNTGSDDWSGRLNYMENAFEKIVHDAKKELSAEMVALETRIYEHDLTTRETLNHSDTSPSIAASRRNLMTFPMRRS